MDTPKKEVLLVVARTPQGLDVRFTGSDMADLMGLLTSVLCDTARRLHVPKEQLADLVSWNMDLDERTQKES